MKKIMAGAVLGFILGLAVQISAQVVSTITWLNSADVWSANPANSKTQFGLRSDGVVVWKAKP